MLLKFESPSEPVSPSIRELHQLGDAQSPLAATDEQKARVRDAHQRLLNTIETDQSVRIYGVHTFFGENVRNAMNPRAWDKTQADLLEYLQVGVGKALPQAVVRRALRLQALKVGQGLSGTHPSTFQALIDYSNSAELASVPREGSLGASGDLISMAHAVSPIFKDGIAGPRDVLSLVNTNAMMASWAIEHFRRLEALVEQAIDSTALTSIALGAGEEHFGDGLTVGNVHAAYREAGQKILAARERFLRAPRIIEGEKSLPQARYSVRCAPQVIGHCLDLMRFAEMKILSEATSVADNPVVLADGRIWHGGLFYAIGIAAAADAMSEVSHRLGEMLDRQTLVLMDSNLNGGLEDNLRREGFSHCKGIHQLLSALQQKLKGQSTPSRALSFSCEGNNQDLVPCGMAALNHLADALETLGEITRGALFCSVRGATMRIDRPLSNHLKISEWPKFHAGLIAEVVQ